MPLSRKSCQCPHLTSRNTLSAKKLHCSHCRTLTDVGQYLAHPQCGDDGELMFDCIRSSFPPEFIIEPIGARIELLAPRDQKHWKTTSVRSQDHAETFRFFTKPRQTMPASGQSTLAFPFKFSICNAFFFRIHESEIGKISTFAITLGNNENFFSIFALFERSYPFSRQKRSRIDLLHHRFNYLILLVFSRPENR